MKISLKNKFVFVLLYLFILNNNSFGQAVELLDTIGISKASINGANGYQNIAYDTLSSKHVVSALASVKGESLDKNFTLNLGNTLFGRLPGVLIGQGSAEPGVGSSSFYVRGENSFGGESRSPLFIVDGFIMNGYDQSNAFMQMIPEEIEDITVLKDAAATAVYGMRAANGVILVTTKKGSVDGMHVSFSTKQGISQAQYMPKFLDSYNYAKLYNEAAKNDGVLVPKFTVDDLEAYRLGNDPYFHPDVNWYNEVLRKHTPVSSYNLSLNGGNSFVKYFVVLNAMNSQGLLKKFGDLDEESTNSKYSKYNFRTNINFNITKRLSGDFRIGGSVEESSNPYNYNLEGLYWLLSAVPPNSFPVYNPDGSWGGNALYNNPYAALKSTGSYTMNSRTILSSLKVTEQLDFITRGLSISGAISLNNFFKSGTSKTKGYPRYPISQNEKGDTIYSATIGQLSNLSGDERILDQYRNITTQGFINYKRNFRRSNVDAMLMISTDKVEMNGPENDPATPSAGSTDPYRHNNGAGRINYVFDDKYIAEATVAYTGSNLFPVNRYGFFPAGALGWIISNENFLKNNKAFSFLKIRGSYGVVGNDMIRQWGSSRYAYLPSYGSPSYFFGTNNTQTGGYYENNIGIDNLTWQKEKQLNIGLDATIFRNLDISVNVFNRDRSGILASASATLPSFAGINIPLLNLGKTNNRGIDVTASYSSNKKKTFQYFIEANITYYNTKIVYSAEQLQVNPLLYTTGLRIRQPLAYHAIGFYSQEDIEKRKTDPKSVPGVLTEILQAGDIKYEDIGGPAGKPDGIIDSYDRMPLGNPAAPDLFGGMHTGLKYKGLDLDIVFQGMTGNTVYLSGNNFRAFQSNGQISEIALGRWTPETAATATYPRLSAIDNLNNYMYSDFWMRDGSFIKLRSVEMGYTFPQTFFKKINLSKFRIFINATNLFSWDKIPYGDPEALSGYPVLTTLTAGIKIQL